MKKAKPPKALRRRVLAMVDAPRGRARLGVRLPWGLAFALVVQWVPDSALIQGILLGIAAVLAAHLLIAPLKGGSIAQGWEFHGLAVSLAINCFWGIGVALLLPSLQSGRSRRS